MTRRGQSGRSDHREVAVHFEPGAMGVEFSKPPKGSSGGGGGPGDRSPQLGWRVVFLRYGRNEPVRVERIPTRLHVGGGGGGGSGPGCSRVSTCTRDGRRTSRIQTYGDERLAG